MNTLTARQLQVGHTIRAERGDATILSIKATARTVTLDCRYISGGSGLFSITVRDSTLRLFELV